MTDRGPEQRKRTFTWPRTYAIGAVIALAVVVLTVWLPSQLLDRLASSSRSTQDLLGAGLWVVGLVAVLVTLRWAQRSGRI